MLLWGNKISVMVPWDCLALVLGGFRCWERREFWKCSKDGLTPAHAYNRLMPSNIERWWGRMPSNNSLNLMCHTRRVKRSRNIFQSDICMSKVTKVLERITAEIGHFIIITITINIVLTNLIPVSRRASWGRQRRWWHLWDTRIVSSSQETWSCLPGTASCLREECLETIHQVAEMTAPRVQEAPVPAENFDHGSHSSM